MIKTVQRLKRIRELLNKYWEYPYVKGRIMQVGGVALLADGLFGLENPLDGRRNKRPGILTGFVSIIVGLLFVFFFSGMFTENVSPYENGKSVQGTVVSIAQSKNSDSIGNGSDSIGNKDSAKAASCSSTAEYVVEGETYSATSTYSSSGMCNDQGKSVEISYLSENPEQGKIIMENSGLFAKVITILPWLLIIYGLFMVVVRGAEIIFGVIFFFKGRTLVAENEEFFVEDVLDELKDVWVNPTQPVNKLEE